VRLDYMCQAEYNRRVKDRQLESLETLFKALADRTRLRILGLLASGEVCVCDIHQSLALPQPTTSRHLAYLRRAGLVSARKDGLWVHYRLTDLPDAVARTVVDAVRHALGHLSAADKDKRRLAQRRPAVFAPEADAPCCSSPTQAIQRPCCAPE
jgi:ArsR family transcriptional regulator